MSELPEASLLSDEKFNDIKSLLTKVEAETYDTILGNQELEGNLFAGTKVSNMSLDDLIEFSKVNGAYADYSKRAVGRVATPMGKYQIVGTVLKSLKERFNLPGSTIFTPELQDRFFLTLFYDEINKGGTLDDKVDRLNNVWEGFKLYVPREELKNAIKNI